MEMTALEKVPGGARRCAREAVLVAGAAAVYGGVRAITEGSVRTAVANGEGVLALERRLGIAWEASVQSELIGSDTLVAMANWIYIWGHWPVIVASAVALYRCRRSSYLLLRNAMFVSGAIGFAFFALLPTAPPRLLDAGLVDTVAERSEAYRALQPPALTNQYAAFPSLHVGWNVLVGIVLAITFTHWAIRTFAVVMPLAMALAVIASANHYVLDVLAGGSIVVVSLVLVSLVSGGASPVVSEAVAPASSRARPSERPRVRVTSGA